MAWVYLNVGWYKVWWPTGDRRRSVMSSCPVGEWPVAGGHTPLGTSIFGVATWGSYPELQGHVGWWSHAYFLRLMNQTWLSWPTSLKRKFFFSRQVSGSHLSRYYTLSKLIPWNKKSILCICYDYPNVILYDHIHHEESSCKSLKLITMNERWIYTRNWKSIYNKR